MEWVDRLALVAQRVQLGRQGVVVEAQHLGQVLVSFRELAHEQFFFSNYNKTMLYFT